MLSPIRRIHKLLDACTRCISFASIIVATLALALIVIDLGAGSIMRYTIKYIPAWYEELAKFFLIWLTFSGTIVAMANGEHIAINIFSDKMNRRLLAAIALFAQIGVVTVCCIVCKYGWKFAQGGLLGVFPSMDILPLFAAYVALPLGFLGIGIVSVRNIAGQLLMIFGRDDVKPA